MKNTTVENEIFYLIENEDGLEMHITSNRVRAYEKLEYYRNNMKWKFVLKKVTRNTTTEIIEEDDEEYL